MNMITKKILICVIGMIVTPYLSCCLDGTSDYVDFYVPSVVNYNKDNLSFSCEPNATIKYIEVYTIKLSKEIDAHNFSDILAITMKRGVGFRTVWYNRDFKERSYELTPVIKDSELKLEIPVENVTFSDEGVYKCEISAIVGTPDEGPFNAKRSVRIIGYTDVTTINLSPNDTTIRVQSTSVNIGSSVKDRPITTFDDYKSNAHAVSKVTGDRSTINNTDEPTSNIVIQTTLKANNSYTEISIDNVDYYVSTEDKYYPSTSSPIILNTEMSSDSVDYNVSTKEYYPSTSPPSSFNTELSSDNVDNYYSTKDPTHPPTLSDTDLPNSGRSTYFTKNIHTTIIPTTAVTVESSKSNCDAFFEIAGTQCPANQGCKEDSNGVPYCGPLESTENFALTVGLGVGIPLFFIAVGLIVVLCIYNHKLKSKQSIEGSELDRTMPYQGGFFTSAIPGRFNSFSKAGPFPFTHSRWDDESVESDRGAYDNEMFRGKEPYVYDNRTASKPDNFSWDFIFQRLPSNQQEGQTTSIFHHYEWETRLLCPSAQIFFVEKQGGGQTTSV